MPYNALPQLALGDTDSVAAGKADWASGEGYGTPAQGQGEDGGGGRMSSEFKKVLKMDHQVVANSRLTLV